jgi:lipopolysaccharide transport system ATP-binding protein
MIIKTTNLTKMYPLYSHPVYRIWEFLDPFRRSFHKDFYALSKVSLEIEQGECIGIIGMNGSGKSTLLQMLAQVVTPTAGELEVRGTVGALLELGAGFHGAFTGLENIAFQCALMKIPLKKRPEVIQKIIEYAQIGEFIHQSVRHYSSGMFVRLAFASAIHMDPDILIVDEALAVGDMYFQTKCLDTIRSLKNKGKTMLFVSHDASAIKMLCDRAYLLHRGQIIDCGKPKDVFDHYNNLLGEQAAPQAGVTLEDSRKRIQNGKVSIVSSEIRRAHHQTSDILICREPFVLEIVYKIEAPIQDLTIGLSIRDRMGYEMFGINNKCLGIPIDDLSLGLHKISYKMDCMLGPNIYTVSLAAHPGDNHIGECYDWFNEALVFRVIPDQDVKFVGACFLPTELSLSSHSAFP